MSGSDFHKEPDGELDSFDEFSQLADQVRKDRERLMRTEARRAEPTFPGAKSEDAPLGRLQKYAIVERVGAGGFGWVYRAFDTELRRTVAIKVLGDCDRGAFTEVRNAARIQTDAVPAVYDVQEQSDTFPYNWFVMKMVSGRTLQEFLNDNLQLAEADVLDIGIQIARCLRDVHREGVVHRDLKPANILVSRSDGSLENSLRAMPGDAPSSAGRSFASLEPVNICLTDFGLSARSDFDSLTSTGGTPEYMSPEQVQLAGNSGDDDIRTGVDKPSDVYSVGVILYEAATGTLPFRRVLNLPRSAARSDLFRRIVEDSPPCPREINNKISHDLTSVILKCLNKIAVNRYADGAELLRELINIRQGFPAAARDVGFLTKVLYFAARKKLQGYLIMTLVIGTVVSVFFAVDAANKSTELKKSNELLVRKNSELGVSQGQLTQANTRLEGKIAELDSTNHALEISQEETMLNLYPTDTRLAYRDWDAGRIRLVRERLAKWIPSDESQRDFREFAWFYLWHASNPDRLNQLYRHDAGVRSLALRKGNLLSLGLDRKVQEYDRGGGLVSTVLTVSTSGVGVRQQLSPKGMWAAWHGNAKTEIWNTVTQTTVLSYLDEQVVGFGSEDEMVITAASDLRIAARTLPTGDILAEHRLAIPISSSVVVDPDGRHAYFAASSSLYKWHLADSSIPEPFEIPIDHAVSVISISPNGEFLATTSKSGSVTLWNARERTRLQSLQADSDMIRSIAFSPTSRKLVFGTQSGAVLVWDIESGTRQRLFRGHTASVDNIMFLSDEAIVSADSLGVVLEWHLTDNQESEFADTAVASTTSLTWTNDDSRILVASSPVPRRLSAHLNVPGASGELLEIDQEKKTLERTIQEPLRIVYDVAANTSANELVVASYTVSPPSTRLEHWSVDTGQRRRLIDDRSGDMIISCDWIPNHNRVLTVSGNASFRTIPGHAQVIDTKTGNQILQLTGQRNALYACAVSPSGKYLVGGDAVGNILVWDSANGSVVKSRPLCTQSILCLEFSPDGTALVVGAGDPTALSSPSNLYIVDPSAWETVATLGGHNGMIEDVAYSASGKQLISVSLDSTAIVWDTESWNEIERIPLSGPGSAVCFVNDDREAIFSTASNGFIGPPVVNRVKLATQEEVARYPLTDVVFSRFIAIPEQKAVLSASGRGLSLLQTDSSDVHSNALILDDKYHGLVLDIEYCRKRSEIACACVDGVVRIRDAESGVVRQEFGRSLFGLIGKGHTEAVTSVAYSPDQGLIASGSKDGTVHIWNTTDGVSIADFSVQRDAISSLSFLDANHIVAGTTDFVQTGLKAHGESVVQTGRLLIWNRNDKTLFCDEKTPLITDLTVSGNGNLLFTGHFDGTVIVWSITDAKHAVKFRSFRGHYRPVNSVSVSADGQTVATGSDDGTVRLWHVPTGQELAVLSVDMNPAEIVCFSHSGDTLAAGFSTTAGHIGSHVVFWNAERQNSP